MAENRSINIPYQNINTDENISQEIELEKSRKVAEPDLSIFHVRI